ncbi:MULTISPECIES: DUF2336 domain-containing protein [unclassified Brevundimonas]|uniref:DUF2336 domain-containing protein n=1 Tax=unclassified Brevundimonas TaxID=2622653 RepID=UPI001FD7BAD2|nr:MULTISPECIES: DUF2336 domain-containing protein [unclassified Brevundimonas]
MTAAPPFETPEMSDLEPLLALARSRSCDDRRALIDAVSTLCESQRPDRPIHPALAQIFLALAGQAEREIRRALAERLAHVHWAPPSLINMLALDEIEIARPVIAASPLLGDADLLRILIEASLDHQIEVARRPGLGGAVADAIIDQGDPAVMIALSGNRTAEIGAEGLRRLVEQSRRVAGLRAPLVRHPRLTESLAREMHRWIGQALQQAISDRFRIDPDALSSEIDEAVNKVMTGWSAAPIASRRPDEAEQDEMERRLVAKLKAAGQLRPGFVVRAAMERRLSLFEHALAGLGDLGLGPVRAAVRAATSARPLYLACAAAGVDRAVFPDLLSAVRRMTGGFPRGEERDWADALSRETAAAAFRRLPPPDAVGLTSASRSADVAR